MKATYEGVVRFPYLSANIFVLQDQLARNPEWHGAMFVPVVLGADKTTASIATGHQEYHPVYMSLGNIHNNMRRAHGDAVVPLAFLCILRRT